MTKRAPAGWAASGFKGVYAYPGGWRATVRIAGRPVHVGVFPTPEAAHAAYQARVAALRSGAAKGPSG